MNLDREVTRRRTFAIISHPDAGKTTLTEKLLLFAGAINIAGNAAMFAPAGLLAAFALGWGVRRVSAVALVLSVTIELLQLASGRSADVDDLILNTAGAAVGALLCLLAARLRQQRHSRPTGLGEPPRPTTAT